MLIPTHYGIIPPGLAKTVENLMTENDRVILFRTVTDAKAFLSERPLVNQSYYTIVGFQLQYLNEIKA